MLVREEDAQLLSVHRVFLFLQLVAEVAPVPDSDLGIRVTRLLDLEPAERGQLGVELRLQPGLELLQEGRDRSCALGHFDLRLVVGPRLIAELVGNVVPQRKDLLQQGDVPRPRQVVMGHQQLFARFLPPRVLHHADVVPGDIGHHGVVVITGLDLGQETLRRPLQLGLREHHCLFRLGNIRLKICH